MKTARLIEPVAARSYVAANDNHRSHTSTVLDRAKSGRLFQSPEENITAARTINRLDQIIGSAESDPTYTRAEEGQYTRNSAEEDGDDIGGPAIVEVEGRSAEKIVEDFCNGTVKCHDARTVNVCGLPETVVAELYEHGRFRFNAAGTIMGYRLNREPNSDDMRNAWVSPGHPKYPDNVATPRDRKSRDPRGPKPGKTNAANIVTPANDNFDARSCVKWLKARMAPEHFEAVYDVTAGLGFGEIGTAAGFAGKPADAVGKDRVLCGLRVAARLLAEWDDDKTCT
jgi:hypothetical protein